MELLLFSFLHWEVRTAWPNSSEQVLKSRKKKARNSNGSRCAYASPSCRCFTIQCAVESHTCSFSVLFIEFLHFRLWHWDAVLVGLATCLQYFSCYCAVLAAGACVSNEVLNLHTQKQSENWAVHRMWEKTHAIPYHAKTWHVLHLNKKQQTKTSPDIHLANHICPPFHRT